MKHIMVVLIIVGCLSLMLSCAKKVMVEEGAGAPTDSAVAYELREIGKGLYNEVEVKGETAKMYFAKALDAAFFLNNPNPRARMDLHMFLKKTGRAQGMVEYYIIPDHKVFTIKGSLTHFETEYSK